MKKIFLIITPIILVLAIIFFIPITEKNSTEITTDLYNITLQLKYPENWIKWNQYIKNFYKSNPSEVNIKKNTGGKDFIINIPDHKYDVEEVNPLAYHVKETDQKSASAYVLTIVPVKENRITVVVEKKISLLNYFFHSAKNASDKITIEDLKSFLESSRGAYGFDIEIRKVVNNTIATKRFEVKSDEIFTSLPPSFEEVEKYIEKHKLTPVDTKAVSYSIVNKNSVQIMAGIPVDSPATASNGITCFNIPKQSKIVTAYYEGEFAKRQDIYKAVDKYILDHNLHKAAVPFEEYVDNKLPASDSSQVKFILYYPISD